VVFILDYLQQGERGSAGGASVAGELRCERIYHSAAKLSPGRSQGDAPVKGKEDRGKRGTRGSPTATQSGGYARWFCRLRQRIPSDWRGLARGRKEGRGRGAGAFYRRPCMEEGLGFFERGAMDGQGCCRAKEGVSTRA
jgi:hypothetical protein